MTDTIKELREAAHEAANMAREFAPHEMADTMRARTDALLDAALDAPAESAGEDDAVLDGLISDLADDLAEVSSDGQRERLLGAFRVLLADVLTAVRAARDAEWRDGQVFSSAKPASPVCGSCDDGQVMVDGWWKPCPACAPKQGEECETCGGEGTVDQCLGGDPRSDPEAPCPDCNGDGMQRGGDMVKGKVFPDLPCGSCRGTGRICNLRGCAGECGICESVPCPACNGDGMQRGGDMVAGKVFPDLPCGSCGGSGLVGRYGGQPDDDDREPCPDCAPKPGEEA